MSYARRRLDGAAPEEIYVVSNGKWHKIYTKLSTARGVKTSHSRYAHNGEIKIYKLEIGNLEEVE